MWGFSNVFMCRKTYRDKENIPDEQIKPLKDDHGDRTEPTANTRGYLHVGIICGVFVSLVLNTVLIGLVAYHFVRSFKDEECTKEEDILFLPCSNDGNLKESTGLCRHKTTTSLVTLIYIMFVVNHTTKTNEVYKLQDVSGMPNHRVAANRLLDTTTKKHDKLRWKGIHEYGVSMKDVRYEDGNMIVPINGRYFVYNVLAIKSQNQHSKEQLIHTVFVQNKSSRGLKKTLLQNRIARVRGDLTYQMSDLLSVVELKAGDTLYTTISNASAVYEESFTSVFGIYWMEKGIS